MRCLVWILLCIPALLTAQKGSIAADGLNIFYVGVKNPISIAIPGVPFEKTAVKSSCGIVEFQDGKYTILFRDTNCKQATLSLGKIGKKDTAWLYEKSFRVIKLSPVKIMLGGIDPSQPTGLVLLQLQNSMDAMLPYAPFEGIKFQVIRYNAYLFSSNFGFRKLRSNSNSLAILSESLNSMAEGDFIVFDSIMYSGPDGQIHQAEPVTCFDFDGPVPSIYASTSELNKVNICQHPEQAKNIAGSCELLFEYPFENVLEYPYYTCSTINDASGNLVLRTTDYDGKNISWTRIGGTWTLLNEDSVTAVGNLMPIHGVFDTKKASAAPARMRPDTASKFPGLPEDPCDTTMFLYRIFYPLYNQYLPVGNWKFYYRGQLIAEGEVELEKEIYTKESPYPVANEYTERPYLNYSFPPVMRYADQKNWVSFTIVYYMLGPGKHFAVRNKQAIEELTRFYSAH